MGWNPNNYLTHCPDCIPANRRNLMAIVPIFEFQNLKKSGHSDFLRKKKTFSLGSKVGIFDIKLFVILEL